MKKYGWFLGVVFFMTSCSIQKQMQHLSQQTILRQASFQQAFTGIAIFDAADQSYLYRYNSNRFFVPASNTKLPTLYAGLKHLGNRLPGLNYYEGNDTVYLQPTGDPTFLHPDYKNQPVFDFLKKTDKRMVINNNNWATEVLGYGWAWDDYLGSYMVERSSFPVYGNIIKWIQERTFEQKEVGVDTGTIVYTDPEVNWDADFSLQTAATFTVTRPRTENRYTITNSKEPKHELEIPFVTNGISSSLELLHDTLHKELTEAMFRIPESVKWQTVFSQPADSMLIPLMHRSDNFFAEQTLLMVSNLLTGKMDEQKLIDTLLKTDLSGFPQKPKWVDGSGLSRYNLFTPEDFVWLLLKLKDEFGLERMKTILPTGNEGTLRNYYKTETGFIFAKTGTLSGHVALSGYLYTKKNKLLVFSILVNNHNTSATAIRRAVESFLQQVRARY